MIAHERREIEKGSGPLINPLNLLEVGAWAIARLDLQEYRPFPSGLKLPALMVETASR